MHTDLLQAHDASNDMVASLVEICTGMRKEVVSNFDRSSSDHRHTEDQIASLQGAQTSDLSQVMWAINHTRPQMSELKSLLKKFLSL